MQLFHATLTNLPPQLAVTWDPAVCPKAVTQIGPHPDHVVTARNRKKHSRSLLNAPSENKPTSRTKNVIY